VVKGTPARESQEINKKINVREKAMHNIFWMSTSIRMKNWFESYRKEDFAKYPNKRIWQAPSSWSPKRAVSSLRQLKQHNNS
jgi:hypothetical protein